jgi:3-oxoacyl-[acyl-carrier protein] reductase
MTPSPADLASGIDLTGKVAYVTGSTRGIGAAIARRIAVAGAAVVVNGHTLEEAPARLAAQLSDVSGAACLGIHADQRDPDAVKAAFSTIVKTYGRLDILVNNAGIVDDAILGMISERSMSDTFAVNTLALVRNMQLASRLMRRNGSGSIVNISSIMGVVGNPGEVVYAASKAAVIGATKSAAKELAPIGIRVNAIAPGFIDTDMTRALPADIHHERLASIGMGRIGHPDDVADVALFLACHLSRYVTGQVIGVDGAMVV